MSPQVNEQELFSELDKLGEDEVRVRLAKGAFGRWKIPLVELWLLKITRDSTKEAALRAESAASLAQCAAEKAEEEERRLNRSAVRAAWIAAIAAIIASAWGIIDRIFITK